MSPLSRPVDPAVETVERIEKIAALGLNDAAHAGERAAASAQLREQFGKLRTQLKQRPRRRVLRFVRQPLVEVGVGDGVWHRNGLRAEFKIVAAFSSPPYFYYIETAAGHQVVVDKTELHFGEKLAKA